MEPKSSQGAGNRPLFSSIGWILAVILAFYVGIGKWADYVHNHPYAAPADLGPTSLTRDCSILNIFCDYDLSMTERQYVILTGHASPDRPHVIYNKEDQAIKDAHALDRAEKGCASAPKPASESTQAVTQPTAAVAAVAAKPAPKPAAPKRVVHQQVYHREVIEDKGPSPEAKAISDLAEAFREFTKRPPQAPLVVTRDVVRTVPEKVIVDHFPPPAPPECQGSIFINVRIPNHKIVAMQYQDAGGYISLPKSAQTDATQLKCTFPSKAAVLVNFLVQDSSGKQFWLLDESRPHVEKGKVLGYDPATDVYYQYEGDLSWRKLAPRETKFSDADKMPVLAFKK